MTTTDTAIDTAIEPAPATPAPTWCAPRLPDERPRLRAPRRPARGRGVRARRPAARRADVVIFNTCAVRENAANRLFGNLGQLAPVKRARPGMQIAVGGCLAQKKRAGIVDKAPWVDVVFGTHNLGALPDLLERARHNERGAGGDPGVPRGLPLHAAHPARVRLRGVGLDLAWAATTPAPSASCRACAARSGTAGPATCSPRSRRSSPRAPSRSPCSGRTSTPTASASATGAPSPSCCAPAGRSTGSSGSGSPRRTRPPSPTTSSRRWPRRPT